MRFGTFLMATLLVLAGVVMFMLNLGYGSWEMIRQGLELWPVLLILLGLSLFWGGRIPQWLAIALVVALAGGAIFLFLKTPGLLAERSDKQITVERQQYPGLSSGKADITFGGGLLTLGTSTDEWLEGQFGNRGAYSRVDIRNGNLQAVLRLPRDSWNLGSRPGNWDIQLSPDLKWDLRLNAGGLEGELNLSDIPLERLNLKLGAGEVNLVLGDNGKQTRVKADVGAAKLTLRVMGETGVSVEFDGTLTETNLKELGWTVVNGRYVSPNYDEASSKLDVDLDMAVGEFRLETTSAIPVAA